MTKTWQKKQCSIIFQVSNCPGKDLLPQYVSTHHFLSFSNALPLFLRAAHSSVLVPFSFITASSIIAEASSSTLIDMVAPTRRSGTAVALASTPPGLMIETSKLLPSFAAKQATHSQLHPGTKPHQYQYHEISIYQHTLIFLAFGINHGVFFGSRFASIPLKYTNLKVLPSAFKGARDFVKASAAASVYPISIFLQSSRFGFLWAGEPRALSESASVG